MMKINFRKLAYTLLSLILIMIALLPSAALAQNQETVGQTKEKIGQNQNFCNILDNKNQKFNQQLIDRAGQVSAKQVERNNKIGVQRSERDAKLLEQRGQADDNRLENYTKLVGRAKTDAQKQAVADFRATVENAVKIRRDAIDLAMKNFRQAVDQALNTRKDSLNTVMTNYRQAYQVALDTAKASCAGGVKSTDVRHKFLLAMKEAKNNFTQTRQAVEKIDISVLSKTRNQAIKKAMDDFKITMANARAIIKTTFQK